MDDTRDVLNMLQYWQIHHVKMKANYVIHKLTKTTVKNVIDQVLIEEIPNYIYNIVLQEQQVLS